jgi:hypothetical protein
MDATVVQRAFDDFVDQLNKLTAVEWGFVVIAVAAGFCWAWVMGGPKEAPRKGGAPVAAVGAAVLAGIVCTVAMTLFAPARV